MRLLPKKRNSPGQLPRSLQPLKENHMSIFSDLVDAVKEHSKVVEAVIAELSTPVVEDDVKVETQRQIFCWIYFTCIKGTHHWIPYHSLTRRSIRYCI